MASSSIEVDEDLPDFWSVIKWTDANETVMVSNDSKKRFQFEQVAHFVQDKLSDIVELPKIAIQGSPWYTILASQSYRKQFQFIGANIHEREKLIEDGYPDVDYKDEPSHYKLEQSDMIMVLLNLASIPDSVVKNTDYTVPGWSKVFHNDMDKYASEFNQRQPQSVDFKITADDKPDNYKLCDWKFQDSELENWYI